MPPGLGWLGRTTALAGVLALRPADSDAAGLSITSSYLPVDLRVDGAEIGRPEGGSSLVGQRVEEADFPPATLLRRAAAYPGAVVMVIPVQGGGSRSGLLAVVAQVDNREASGRETFYDWAAMLAVALEHQEVVSSLRRREGDLRESLEREQQLAADIRGSEQRYALAAAAANDGLWDWDLGTGTTYYSERGRAVLGALAPADQISTWLDRVHPEDRPGLEAVIEQQRAGRSQPLEFEHRITTDDGELRWVLCRGLAVVVEGTVTRLVGSLTDVTDRRQLEDRLRRQAMYDSLTNLPNRVLLLDRLDLAIHRANRHSAYRFAVLFIDLDGFKVINDSLGHGTGDKLLMAIAARLQGFVRLGDTAARLGGDEFVVLLDDLAPAVDVSEITKRLQEELAEPFEIDGSRVAVTASIGIITTTSDEIATAEDMLRDADIAMYRSKTAGRGGRTTFDATMRVQLLKRLSVESELRAATEDGSFELHYQPIVALDTAAVHGFEALIRWPHEQRGLIPPGEFLTIAEDSGLIVPIGRWVIGEVCRQIRLWRAEKHPAGRLPVSVNLSHHEFWDGGLLAYLDQAIHACGLETEAMVLEITEGVVMHNARKAQGLLDEMHERGHVVHIDDFGTGYSSLEALHRLRIDALKIDRSFVVAMSSGARSAELAPDHRGDGYQPGPGRDRRRHRGAGPARDAAWLRVWLRPGLPVQPAAAGPQRRGAVHAGSAVGRPSAGRPVSARRRPWSDDPPGDLCQNRGISTWSS